MEKNLNFTAREHADLKERCDPLLDSPAKKRIADLEKRGQLNMELHRWGLSYQQLCTKRGSQIREIARSDNRAAAVKRFSESGDSVASLILALESLDRWYASGVGLDEAKQHLQGSSISNPRAALLLSSLLTWQDKPDWAASDLLLLRSVAQSCAQAMTGLSMRLDNTAAPKRDWQNSFDGDELLQTATAMGDGLAACMQYSNLRKSRASTKAISDSKAEEMAKVGNNLGARACISYIDAFGNMPYFRSKYRLPFGPCAKDDTRCYRDEMRKAGESGYSEATYYYAASFVEAELGGHPSNINEAVRAYRKGIEQGSGEAMSQLGQIYAFAQYGLNGDTKLGKVLCARAHTMQTASGAACLAFLAESEPKAVQLVKKAEAREACSTMVVFQERIDRMRPFSNGDSVRTIGKRLSRSRSSRTILKKESSRWRLMLRTVRGVSPQCASRVNAYEEILDYAGA